MCKRFLLALLCSALIQPFHISASEIEAQTFEFTISQVSEFARGTAFELQMPNGQAFLSFGFPSAYQTSTPELNKSLHVDIHSKAPSYRLSFLGKGGDYVAPKLFSVGNNLIVKPYDLDLYGEYFKYNELGGWSQVNMNQVIKLMLGKNKSSWIENTDYFSQCGNISYVNDYYAATEYCAIIKNGEILSYNKLKRSIPEVNNDEPLELYYLDEEVVVFMSTSSTFNRQFGVCEFEADVLAHENCEFTEVLIENEFPYVVYSRARKVVIHTNAGTKIEYDKIDKVIRKAARSQSNLQLYSAIDFGGQTLLGQYPDGLVLEHGDEFATRPMMQQIPYSSLYKQYAKPEVQALSVFGGNLIAGVWPHGELWIYDSELKQWTILDRLFTQPETTTDRDIVCERDVSFYDKFRAYVKFFIKHQAAEPFECELGHNSLGQRIPFLRMANGRLYGVTSAKDYHATVKDFNSTTAIRSEYGQLFSLKAANHLEVEIVKLPIDLKVTIDRDLLSIYIDKKKFWSGALTENREIPRLRSVLGRGLYGEGRGLEVE